MPIPLICPSHYGGPDIVSSMIQNPLRLFSDSIDAGIFDIGYSNMRRSTTADIVRRSDPKVEDITPNWIRNEEKYEIGYDALA
jgi:hypothetical protein